MVNGYFSINHRKFFGLREFRNDIEVEDDDLLLFTNWGNGQFDVVIFNSLGAEKPMKDYNMDDGKYVLLPQL